MSQPAHKMKRTSPGAVTFRGANRLTKNRDLQGSADERPGSQNETNVTQNRDLQGSGRSMIKLTRFLGKWGMPFTIR